jgi:hypothetical protein
MGEIKQAYEGSLNGGNSMTYLNIIEPDSCWPWKCCQSVIKENEAVYIRPDSSVVKFDYAQNYEHSLSRCLTRIQQVFIQQVGNKLFLGQYIHKISIETGIVAGRFYMLSKPFTKLEIEQIKQAMESIDRARFVVIPDTVVEPVLNNNYIN